MDYYEGNGTIYEAHPSTKWVFNNKPQAPDPGEGIKQVNKQPPNRPNFNIIIIGKNSIVPPPPPASNEGKCIGNEGVGASGFFFFLFLPPLVSSLNLGFNLSVP
jgi:hypothetical protein